MFCKKSVQMIAGKLMRIGILPEPWTAFTQFTILNDKLLDGYMWLERRFKKSKQPQRPDHFVTRKVRHANSIQDT